MCLKLKFKVSFSAPFDSCTIKWVCYCCFKPFFKLQDLLLHEKNCFKKLFCVICGKNYKNQRKYFLHHQSKRHSITEEVRNELIDKIKSIVFETKDETLLIVFHSTKKC